MSPASPQQRRLRRALASALGAVLAVTGLALGTPAALADHTPTPTLVTLVGSLQSELGCDQDWDPACEDTVLEQVGGDAGAGTEYAASFDVPAGEWELKVAIGESFDESYGAGGGADNQRLVVGGPATLRFSYDHTTHRIGIAPAELPGSEVTDADEALATPSLREPLTDERFYFVMADRFANGGTGNDTGGLEGDRLDHGFDPTDKGFFHGGDLAGIHERLDYIEGLGTTAIWLTPSFKNRPVQGSGDDISAGYHGYWVTDFTQIDPHLGTNEEMKELVDAAHERGIKVFFDIITNHTADVIAYEENEYSYRSKADFPYRDADGNVFDDRNFAGTDSFPELDPEISFPYTPVFRTPQDAQVKVPAWLNDPRYYHNRGDSTFAGESSEYGDFFGLDDLFTEHPDVVDGMEDIFRTWVDFGIDGFRVDTVKHVNMEFWQSFGPAMVEHAKATGNDDFFAFGEVFDSSPAFMSRYTTEGKLQATIDFGFQSRAVGFATGRPTTELRDFYAADDYYTDTDSNAYQLPTFLGNHDMGRVGKFIADSGAQGEELQARDTLAHQLMYLTRGQPVVYYGDEQGFIGDGGDKDARQTLFASQVDTYNDDPMIAGPQGSLDRYDTDHPLYRSIAALAALREEHPALADGAQVHRYASSDAGVYAFSRIDREDRREYLVAANNSTTEQQVSLSTYTPRGAFRTLYGGDRESDVRADAEGRVTISVPPLSSVVWEANRPLGNRRHAPSMRFTTPTAGGVVAGTQEDGRTPIGVAVAQDAFAEVSFGWRDVGAADWTPLGTDDNAPYRVFHDVSALPVGSLIEYRAVLRDSSGNLSASSSYGIVGAPGSGGSGPGGGGPGGGVGPVTQPDAVSVPGSHNSEMGCPGDWQPECDAAQLSLGADEIWSGTWTLPAGDYEYKAAINRSWDENYGAGAELNGANIAYTAPGGPVTFYYDHRTNWVTSTAEGPIITAPGSFQSELGCPGDWSPDCMRSWLQDPDGDGTYTFSTDQIPAGSYEVKVAHGLSWDENYGAGGARDGANIGFSVPGDGVVVTFSYVLETHVLTVTTSSSGVAPDLSAAKAHWVTRDLLAWPADAVPTGSRLQELDWRLHWSQAGGLEVDAEAITGGSSAALTLDPDGLPDEVVERFPHLAGHLALSLDRRVARDAEEILTGQLAVAQYDHLGALVDATGVQVPGVLDDVYSGARDSDLGVGWSGRGESARPDFALWAPTAQEVTLLVWPAGASGPDGGGSDAGDAQPRRVEMDRDNDGVWEANGERGWSGVEYLFEVVVWAPSTAQVESNLVTDPYSVALTTNSTRSVAVDLDDPELAPEQWLETPSPVLEQAVDTTIYELHVRDYSIGDDTVPAEQRGTYSAFASDGQGRAHLRDLADAGLNTIHLLPTFDIATIEEERFEQETPPCDLESFPPDSPEQQACISQIRDQDGFNWGYDPLHWTTPEGSYAVEAHGGARVAEFRTMVGALHADDLRVVLDVVYNHTAAAGQDPKSVLDRIVPGYYHRLNPSTGAVETSTCCQNIATEHGMAEKIMVDSLVVWARDYRVDGFRFDLMGHHSVANMEAVREALDELTLRRDGVDGEEIYLYGEGWNFGEVANDARFPQAVQGALDGTGIGTFSDRLRDAVRGGGPFDDDPRIQGLGSGLFTDPNDSPANGDAAAQRARLLHYGDLVKLGLAGNLSDFTFVGAGGEVVRGDEVDYNGSPAGYASEPDEVITYVDAHDNETLWDALTLKLPPDTPMDQRVRMNTLSLATASLSQTPSFWHAGADLLRSKSLDRNSYNSGDWFNSLDWSMQDNGFGRGLPPEADNGAKWQYMQPLLADPAVKPAPQDIATASAAAQDLLELRFSSPLFRLGSAEEIQRRVTFPVGGQDQVPGTVVMHIDDTVGADLDPDAQGLLVVFNATDEPLAQPLPSLAGEDLALSPVQRDGSDPVVRETGWDAASGTVTVPARTVAVLVQR